MQAPDEAPLWPPPKAPLSTQRLASIANALGIPIPAVRTPFTRSPSETASRSQTTSGTTSIPSCSKYLLHVIPPQFLNHGSGKSHRPPLPSTNGYHPQFRRGVLVPVCANFQTQLALIAKEYALPSTTGILLYLVTSPNDSPDTATTTRNEQVNEPGPLLSEEIWKHLWTRVIRVEQMEDNVLPTSTRLYRLGSQSGADESISSSQRDGDSARQLRPFISAGTSRSRSVASSFSPSSCASSTSDLRLNSKSPFMTSSSDPGTPDTSQSSMDEVAIKADRLLLPGLGSPSLIPVLAKVEFDIDHRKAGWLEPWLRSRRVNHAKRFKAKHDGSRELPLAFVTGTKASIDHEDADYTSLSHHSDSEAESDAENATARVSLCTAAHGPVEDVFGTDAGTTAGRRSNERDEKLLKMTSRSQLSVIISSQESLKNLSHGVNAAEDEVDVYTKVRSPEESEKRVGAIFDDLDLGLDPTVEFDDNDQYDKRRSQFLMKAKLDEIEKAMLQCSPRALKTSSEEDSANARQSPSKTTYLTVSPSRKGDARRGQLHHNDDLEIASPTWPSVSHRSSREPIPIKPDDPVAPPQLALNGIATAGTNTVTISTLTRETNDLEEDHSQTIVFEPGDTDVIDDHIPLSPDPIERFPPTVVEKIPHGGIASRARPPTTTITASRFSLDSTDEAVSKSSNRATLVKGIKKLWRRSDKTNSQLPQVPSTGRSSPNQLPPRHERPSKGDSLHTPDATSPVAVDQLPVPSSATSSRSPSPNFAGPSNLEGFHFDQESPYPTRFPSRHSPQPTSPPLPPPPEQKTIRKSILNWTKSRNGSVSQGASVAESRASLEQSRPPSRSGIVEGLRARQPSIVGLIFNKHVPTSSADIPPSPRIPEHFLVNSRHAAPLPTTVSVTPPGQPMSDTNLPRSSTDSHASSEHRTSSSRGSLASSQDSLYTRPSFDTSQFEIVSPKAAALTYPYHGLDHD
ncbi:hypothetical protein M378DRAFT_6312 [Amanita muscaria Koide BX008]|uniref:Uncharacterized protein n=1 Tax=Amanita muscaria (strain Koide BX008) TaxID=946122 RepID=A0A0C2TW10_AMAMK|nr:hypothetical protein M378DRAFT_6312 [Amanita muscaria Koide BX008]